MKKTTLLLLFVGSVLGASAQANEEYIKNVMQAQDLLMAKKNKEAADMYTKAFAVNDGKGFSNDRYNAACAWSLAGNKDSAFFQLFRIAEKMQFSELGQLNTDPDLDPLHDDKRWKEVTAIVKQNKDKLEANLDKPLVAMLDTIYMEDQKYRQQLDEVEKKHGRDSKEIKALWKTIEEKDKANLVKVKKVLDERGWLGPDVVGRQGSSTLFLVIQHSDHETQVKYLPMMREAVKNKKASGSALALLEDRVGLGAGKKQVYGSQIGRFKSGEYYVMPLEDPDNVDKRREEVGLPPLADYVGNWKMKWDVEAYKKQLPEIEKYEKEMQAKK